MTKGQKNLLEKITQMYPSIIEGRMYQAQNPYSRELVKLNCNESRAYQYAIEGYQKYLSIKQPCKTNKESKIISSAIAQYDKGKYLLLALNGSAYRKLLD